MSAPTAVGSMVPRRLPPCGSRPGDKRLHGGAGVLMEAESWPGEDEDEEEVNGDNIADQLEEGENKGGPSTAADARREEEEDQEECR